ncbi:MAG: hypothetical protein CL946_02060 [Ectothiorhodospiraceae bacterium]|nr:hypothetical protein [Ectothiorhodospiraceae bacterium]
MATPLETVQKMYQAFGTGDMETFFGYLHEDVVWESRYPEGVPLGGSFQGHTGVGEFLGKLGTVLEMHDFAPVKMIGDDDTVFSAGYEVVTPKSTGKQYRNEWVHMFSFKDGKVTRVQTSNDAAAAEQAFKSE